MKTYLTIICLLFAVFLAGMGSSVQAQTLNLPPRAANALTGTQFENVISNMSQNVRECWVLAQVVQGNVPSWMRTLVPITVNQTISGTNHTLTYYVLPDYLSIGSDTDYFQEPMTPILAQRICNLIGCTLPTRLMVNEIWTNSAVKMTAYTITPTNNNNDTVPVFILENNQNMSQRFTTTNSHPLGTLVSGDKKDIIISTLIYTNFANGSSGVTNVVVIYGWIQPSGSPIQTEYNGHSEVYMDYSHGVRLVQMNCLLDGVTNTITNIESNPILYPLLDDEGLPITIPYYTLDSTITQSPFIVTQPFSQNIKQGQAVSMSVVATGFTPMSYQWRLNGANVAGGTNSTLTFTNTQAASAGTYTVLISNSYGLATNIPTILRVSTNAFPLLFNDPMSVDTSSNWNFYYGSAGGPDYTTNWAFNYGATPYTWNGNTYLIPPAPSTTNGATSGLRLTVNDSNGINLGVSVFPKNKFFTNNFALKFDMWLNYPGGANGSGATGTTEYATCGINHLGTEVDWASTNAISSDGIFFATDGEGGSTRDFRDYMGNSNGNPTDLMGSASGLVATIHTSPPFPTLFPANRFETQGAPGKEWVGGEIDQSNGVVTWKMDGTIVAQLNNTPTYNSGNIMLGYMDIFPSIANPLSDAYLIFANVRVEDWTSAPILAPTVSVTPTNVTASTGSLIPYQALASGGGPYTYQWSFNGTNIPGATNSTYSLFPVVASSGGTYGVMVTNLAGIAISGTQLGVKILPFGFNPTTVLPNGNVQLSFYGAYGSQYTIQTSSNLVTWISLITLTNNDNPVIFTDTNASGTSKRFYRLATAQ